MIRLNVPVSIKCKTDKPGCHKDGSGHHHPMRIHPSNGCSRRHLPPEWLRGGVSSFRHPRYPERFRISLDVLGSRTAHAHPSGPSTSPANTPPNLPSLSLTPSNLTPPP